MIGRIVVAGALVGAAALAGLTYAGSVHHAAASPVIAASTSPSKVARASAPTPAPHVTVAPVTTAAPKTFVRVHSTPVKLASRPVATRVIRHVAAKPKTAAAPRTTHVTAAPTTTTAPKVAVAPHSTKSDCDVALAYMAAHANPAFSQTCEIELDRSNAAQTNWVDGGRSGSIIIYDPACVASYENEASNSWYDFEALPADTTSIVLGDHDVHGRVWDPYGACP